LASEVSSAAHLSRSAYLPGLARNTLIGMEFAEIVTAGMRAA
jgi:hypothetical protein